MKCSWGAVCANLWGGKFESEHVIFLGLWVLTLKGLGI